MKKFEEEVKRPVIGIEQSSIKPSLGKAIEFYTGKVKEYHNAFNEMNKYIDGLESQLDYYKKDKRFEVMAEEILSLKSQLEKQKPEIPEVPQFMDEWLKSDSLEDLIDVWYNHTSDLPENVKDYLDSLGEDITTSEYCYKEIVHLIARAKLDGCTVEKPKMIVSPCPVCGYQDVESNFCGICGHKNEYIEIAKEKRFYLKNKLTGLYLRSYTGISMNDTTLRFEEVSDNRACGFGGGTQFTQQEIDSMETGSYEKIEVEE